MRINLKPLIHIYISYSKLAGIEFSIWSPLLKTLFGYTLSHHGKDLYMQIGKIWYKKNFELK